MLEDALIRLLTPDVLGHIVYAVVLLVILLLSEPVYLAFRKRRAGFGVVFNSHTGNPEPLVTVRLVTPGNDGRTVSTVVTDRDGRYRLMAHPGEYLVDVKKEGFRFPSKFLKEKSSVYDNILPSARIIIKDHGVITKNIPLDPLVTKGRSKVFRGGIHLSKTAQYALAYASPFLLVWYPKLHGTAAAWIMFSLYVAVIMYRMFTYKPAEPAFGTVIDALSRQPVEQAIVRILSTKFNKLLETQVTGPRGRYAFVVQPGSYYLLIKKAGYRSLRINYPAIKKNGFILAKDATLHRAPAHYVDEHPEPTPAPIVSS